MLFQLRSVLVSVLIHIQCYVCEWSVMEWLSISAFGEPTEQMPASVSEATSAQNTHFIQSLAFSSPLQLLKECNNKHTGSVSSACTCVCIHKTDLAVSLSSHTLNNSAEHTPHSAHRVPMTTSLPHAWPHCTFGQMSRNAMALVVALTLGSRYTASKGEIWISVQKLSSLQLHWNVTVDWARMVKIRHICLSEVFFFFFKHHMQSVACSCMWTVAQGDISRSFQCHAMKTTCHECWECLVSPCASVYRHWTFQQYSSLNGSKQYFTVSLSSCPLS